MPNFKDMGPQTPEQQIAQLQSLIHSYERQGRELKPEEEAQIAEWEAKIEALSSGGGAPPGGPGALHMGGDMGGGSISGTFPPPRRPPPGLVPPSGGGGGPPPRRPMRPQEGRMPRPGEYDDYGDEDY